MTELTIGLSKIVKNFDTQLSERQTPLTDLLLGGNLYDFEESIYEAILVLYNDLVQCLISEVSKSQRI